MSPALYKELPTWSFFAPATRSTLKIFSESARLGDALWVVDDRSALSLGGDQPFLLPGAQSILGDTQEFGDYLACRTAFSSCYRAGLYPVKQCPEGLPRLGCV